MPRYLGADQIAICMRSGAKCRAKDLIRDGRNPHLLVLPEWYDPPHPQERPYQPDESDGLPRYDVSPDQRGSSEDEAPVLSGEATFAAATLAWEPAESADAIVDYLLYRDDVLLATLDGLGIAPDYAPTTNYVDSTVVPTTEYDYRVDAVTDTGRTLASNTVMLTPPAFVAPSAPSIGGSETPVEGP